MMMKTLFFSLLFTLICNAGPRQSHTTSNLNGRERLLDVTENVSYMGVLSKVKNKVTIRLPSGKIFELEGNAVVKDKVDSLIANFGPNVNVEIKGQVTEQAAGAKTLPLIKVKQLEQTNIIADGGFGLQPGKMKEEDRKNYEKQILLIKGVFNVKTNINKVLAGGFSWTIETDLSKDELVKRMENVGLGKLSKYLSPNQKQSVAGEPPSLDDIPPPPPEN